MNFREDYFKSPHPRGFEFFNFGNDRIHHDADQLFENNLFNNISQCPKSPSSIFHLSDAPFPFTTPIVGNNQKNLVPDKPQHLRGFTPVSDKHFQKNGPGVIKKQINFIESEDDEFIETPCKASFENGQEGHATTATKKYDLRFVGSACSRKTTRQNERGLRVLSKLAYQIVLESGPTTYKQVADKLITEQNEEERMDDKQRQNIKRRVYDALNVLIALGELDKKGRKIIKSKRRQKIQEEENKLIQNKSKLLAKLKKKRDLVSEKRQERQRMMKLQRSMKKLITKNHQRREGEMVDENKLLFPLIFIDKANVKVQVESPNCRIIPTNSEQIVLKGDSDVLAYLLPFQK